jgi:hypothetical protein
MYYSKFRFMPLLALILIIFNVNGQTDSIYKAKYYEYEFKDATFEIQNIEERIFKQYIKEIDLSLSVNFFKSNVVLQVKNEFWQINLDSIYVYKIEGDLLYKSILFDSILNVNYNGSFIRCMAYDGEFIYAVTNEISKVILIINPITKSIINKIFVNDFYSGFNGNINWITYDKSADSNRGGFWIGNFYNNFSQIDKQGNVLNTIVVPRDKIGEVRNVLCDNSTSNGPFLWCIRTVGYSPNDLDIIPISIKNDSTFGQILSSKHSLVFDDDLLNFENPVVNYVFINKGFIDNQDVFLVYSYGKYIRFYPMSFPTTDVSVEPFVATSTYTQWPLYAIDTVWLKGKINNASPFTQFGAELSLNIVKDGNIEQSFSGAYNLQPFENKEVVFGPFFPTSKGIYTLESHAALAEDEDATNDYATSTIAITDSTYSRDIWDFISSPTEFVDYKHIWGPSLGIPGNGGSNIQGASFTIDKPMVLTSISAFLKPTEANDATRFQIRKTKNYINPYAFAQTVQFSAKLEDVGKIKQYTIPIEGGKLHLDKGTYFIDLIEAHTPNRLVYTRNNYVPYLNKYYGYDLYFYAMEEENNIRGALTIRPNFACRNELLAPSVIQSSQVLSCNTQYTDLKFQWYKNNVPVGGATNKNFYPRGEAGKYSVRINKENCYAMSAVFEIVTGIFNANSQNLNIYPNPTNGKAFINTDATMHGDMEIQIMDILGKTINTQIIKNTQPNQTIPIDLKNMPKGVYIIQAQIGALKWEAKLVLE